MSIIFHDNEYAKKVDAATTGLKIGPASKYATAPPRGTPLRSNLRTIGTMAHSHTGNIIPSPAPIHILSHVRFGKNFVIVCFGMKTSMAPDISVPINMNGSASSTIATNSIPNVMICSDLLNIAKTVNAPITKEICRKSPAVNDRRFDADMVFAAVWIAVSDILQSVVLRICFFIRWIF
jgi:hypothetical protein